MTQRRVAVVTTVTGLVCFAALAGSLITWHPVPGGPITAPRASTYFTSAQIARGDDFASWARIWGWLSLAVSLLTAGVLGFSRWGAVLLDRVRGPWWWRVVIAAATLLVISRVLTLPFAILLRRRVLDYGLSDQAWSAYAVDLIKGEAVQIGAVSLGLLALMAVARRWTRAWPAVAGLSLAGLVLLGSFAYPLLVEPLFNRFTALPDGELRSSILTLADREHVAVDDVLVADASRRTTTLNAYVSGFGSSRRVVLYDNLVAGGPEDPTRREVLSVVAHELAHARQDDVLTGSLLGAAGALAGVGLLGLLAGTRARVEVRDPRSVPRILALVAIATFVVLPVENGISRAIETRADVGALSATGDPEGFIALQQDLARRSLADLTPPRWSQFWFGSHPTTLTRIAIALRIEEGASGP